MTTDLRQLLADRREARFFSAAAQRRPAEIAQLVLDDLALRARSEVRKFRGRAKRLNFVE